VIAIVNELRLRAALKGSKTTDQLL